MSGYGLPGASGPGDAEANPNFESLLAQLRLQSSPSPGPAVTATSGPDFSGQFAYGHAGQPFYGRHSNSESPNPNLPGHGQNAVGSPAFLPKAPTPPVGSSHAQFPPGLLNSMSSARGGAPNPPGMADDRTAHLLNLLKYSGQNGPEQQQQQQQVSPAREPPVTFAPASIGPPVIHAPAPAAADPSGLLAALMKGTLQSEPAKPEPSSSSTWNQASPPSGTQQYLLNLLNRPKPSQHDAPDLTQPSLLTPSPAADDQKDGGDGTHGGRSADPAPAGTLASRSEFDFEPKGVGSPPPKFNSTQHSRSGSRSGAIGYSDAFGALSGSSPADRTPRSSAATPGASGATAGAGHPGPTPTQILKKPDSSRPTPEPKRPLSGRGAPGSPDQARRNAEHASPPVTQINVAPPAQSSASPVSTTSGATPQVAPHGAEAPRKEPKDSVAGMANGIARQTIVGEEALARAEHEQPQAQRAQELEQPAAAGRDAESSPSSQVVSSVVAKGMGEEEGKALLDTAPPAEPARESKDSGDDVGQAANAPVADSWESAEAEDNAAAEDTVAPIKVYNFPMKPWITISLQETDETRPVFRDDAILDIARLKKDFDQVDRNLVSASETYMAYGMSKAGGLRVIRQEDGKDAKLFTDTKDRVFNVAISTSAAHHHPKEAIIGTGVSGTVYWVQLKNGDRDHLEDAHPEQYGFALPPLSAQEGGDAPGGVLKTRARPSSMHPEFFAIGRGKSISIIWPSFVFEHNLFRGGHDRVVDTDRLLRQCSLKINTGKAGKDFTFSQDDTLVVSLDKSGRVKFWDVRDLTAVKEGSDPLNPMPARTSLEIREPLMTLTTTPEGEKAWPTSVLLLDKFRPYQKRTALRYMIVGMKQNHTLQLWDLALGKPVQEFNFPHNKESDAVCSVMYHAPSNMIVVGHPTRNSIYFLHLSAPKYTLKNISQVDYIQRLVSQDSSIPQPESTAVISGIREYSFANKGVLRSLNILENPAASGDGEEPTLFELYAMHSKGVTCLVIKQSDLGWTKDNKVIAPADAVEAGLAKISKLVAPAPLQPAEAHHPSAASDVSSATPQIRIATRGSKDSALKMPSPPGDERKGPESAAPPKTDRKDEADAPAPVPERSEKKGRKKKAAAAASSAERDHLASNGASEIGRAASQARAGRAPRTAEPSEAGSSRFAADAPLAANAVSQEHLDAVVAKMESRIVANMSGRFDTVFNEIVKQMQSFQDSRDSAFANNQSALLQMVADVLNDNTEAVLKNLIIAQINNNVIPSVRSAIDKSVSDQLGAKSSAQMNAIQKEVQRLLPNAVNQTMQKPEVVRSIADKVCHSVNAHVEAHIAKSLSALTPALAQTAAQSVHQRVLDDVNSRIGEVFERLEERRRAEDARLDRLIAQTQDLSNAIASLAASHTQIQRDLAALKQHMGEQGRERISAAEEHLHGHAHARRSAGSRELVNYPPQHQHQPPVSHPPHPSQHPPYSHQHPAPFGSQEQQVVFAPASREERHKLELSNLVETIDGLMRSGNYDEAMLRWLQSGDKAEEVFQQVLSNYNPVFVHELQPLLLLSVGATLSVDLSRNTQKLMKKVNLLEVVIYAFNQNLGTLVGSPSNPTHPTKGALTSPLSLQDDQVREVTPKIMTMLKTRIEQLFLDISRVAPHDASLKTLSNMSQVAGRIADSVQMRHGHIHGPAHMGPAY